MPKLVVLLPGGATRDVRLRKDRITIGRRADNDVCLADPTVSGEHAAVVTILSDSFLEDLGSTNGTIVNGNPVAKHFLHDGDVIDLGRERLVYLVDESAHPEGVKPPHRPHTAAPATPWPEAGSGAVTAPSPPVLADAGVSRNGTVTESRHAAPAVPETAATVSLVTQAVGAAVEPPELLVLTGPSAGRSLRLTKEVTSLGRVGVQVTLIRRTPAGYRVIAGEGSRPPSINGTPLPPGGALLEPGDILEVAGARVEFCAAPQRDT